MDEGREGGGRNDIGDFSNNAINSQSIHPSIYPSVLPSICPTNGPADRQTDRQIFIV